MENIIYWIGDTPIPLVIDVKDEKGRTVNLVTGITDYELYVYHTGKRIDTSSVTLDTTNAAVGRFVINWPDESIFTSRGEHLVQLQFTGPGRSERTSSYIVKVKEPGRD